MAGIRPDMEYMGGSLIFCFCLFLCYGNLFLLTFPFEDLSDERPGEQGSAIRGRLIIFSAGLMHIEICGGGGVS